MIAAIYARKSTEQAVSDDQKSIARQVDHARQYASRKGWRVDEACIFTDDGISGAEFTRRPGFLRLMNSLKPRPPFQVLVMSEESRLGRESIETAYALKQLVQAGVRVFFYLEDRERTLDSLPTKSCSRSPRSRMNWSARRRGSAPTMPCFGRRGRDTSRAAPCSGIATWTCSTRPASVPTSYDGLTRPRRRLSARCSRCTRPASACAQSRSD
jgi:hypothetical protein